LEGFQLSFFQKLFRKPAHENNEPSGDVSKVDETVPVSGHEPVHKGFNPPQYVTGCGHSIGKQREHNEDALFTLATTLVSDEDALPFGLFLVADGMGGHQHGEMASGVAVRAMASHVISQLYSPLFSLSPVNLEGSLHEIMETGIQQAHRAILQQAPGGGSTLTGVLAMGEQLTIAHVGDSRAYLIREDGLMELLTRDHSLVKRLVELGQITTDEAAVHPQRNVLYRALGQGEPIDAEITTAPLPTSGHLLICSDGLWGLVPEEEIARIVTASSSPAEACQLLIEAANQAGGPDNITAILVRVPG
jgi:serine/threonine protein phosphatase PrpC